MNWEEEDSSKPSESTEGHSPSYRSSERKSDKKKKKKSGHREHTTSISTGSQGGKIGDEFEEKKEKKKKSKRRKEESVVESTDADGGRSSRKSRNSTSSDGRDNGKYGELDDPRLSGRPKRGDDNQEDDDKKPRSREGKYGEPDRASSRQSSRAYGSASSRRGASDREDQTESGKQPTGPESTRPGVVAEVAASARADAGASASLSQFERDVQSKNSARRRSTGAATAPGVVPVSDLRPQDSYTALSQLEQEALAKSRARGSSGAVAATGGDQRGKSRRSSRASTAGTISTNIMQPRSADVQRTSLQTFEEAVASKSRANSSRATDPSSTRRSNEASGSARSNRRRPEDSLPPPSRATVEPAAISTPPGSLRSNDDSWQSEGDSWQAGAAVAGAAVVGAAMVTAPIVAQGASQPVTVTPEAGDEAVAENDFPEMEGTSRDADAATVTAMEDSFVDDDEDVGVTATVEQGALAEMYPGANVPDEGGALEAFVADNVVDAMGVAVVMSAEEEKKIERRKYKQYLILAFVCFVIVAVAIVVPVVVVLGKEEPMVPTSAPSSFPSMTPSVAPTSLTFDEVITRLVPISGEEIFQDKRSPQYLAAEWVADEDPLQLPVDSPQLLQRYLLATFYFATNGDDWLDCGRNDAVCRGDTNETTWLSAAHECTWLANQCVDDVNVDQIFFTGTFGNDLNGTLPYEISQLSKLESLILQNNFLRGTIPDFLANVSLLHTLILSGNLYEGTIPEVVLESTSLLGTIHLSKMNLTGSIPTAFGALPLADLRLDENGFSGQVPSELGSVAEMRTLELQFNELVGTIPESVFALPSLATFRANDNLVDGSIPATVSQAVKLQELWLNGTAVGGTLPEVLYALPKLTSLLLGNSDFRGTLSENVGALSQLKFLELQNNKFSGSIPVGLDSLTNLNDLILHGNDFVGTISQALCARKGSNFFDLQNLTADCAPPSPQVTCPEECCDVCL